MALEYFDGFDDCNSSQIGRYWNYTALNANSALNATGGRNNSGYLVAGNGNSCVGKTLSNNFQTVSCGFAFNPRSFNGSAGICAFNDVSTNQVDIRVNSPSGTICATRNGTTLGTSTFALQAGIWYYVEVAVKIDPSVGTVTVNVNGTQVLALTGQNTRASGNSYANMVYFGWATGNNSANAQSYYDDTYIDNAGTFYGDCRVETSLPNANGATDNFTRGGSTINANNYQQVSDNPADDDTTYNYSSTAGDVDLYGYPAISTTSGNVQAVMTVPVLRNDSAGTTTAESVYRSGGTNYFGSAHNVGSTTYNAYPDIQAVDPNTGVAWTVSGVNAAQYGLKRTA